MLTLACEIVHADVSPICMCPSACHDDRAAYHGHIYPDNYQSTNTGMSFLQDVVFIHDRLSLISALLR